MASRRMCALAFQKLGRKLTPATFPKDVIRLSQEEREMSAPLFVTWTICDSPTVATQAAASDDEDQWNLRGCIGTFAPSKLSEALPEYALTSALQDTRFPPISKAELPKLRCSVSILGEFEPTKDIRDWEVGKHGVYLILRDPNSGRQFRGTFLPEVAKEQEWTVDETLEHLLAKAGYRGRFTKSLEEHMTLLRYDSTKAHLTYSEFLTMYTEALKASETGTAAGSDE